MRIRRVGSFTLLLACACGSAVPGGGLPGWFALRTSGPRSAALGIGASADDLRTGWYPNQPALHPVEVSSPSFQQLFDVALDGQIYAQPLLFPGGLLIATENNHVYVLDPGTGAAIADRPLEPPWHAADLGCGDLVPNVGITGTPVIDPSTNTAYLTTKTYASGTSGPAALFFHALDLPTLAERPGFPVPIQGSADNQTDVTFDPTHQLQRTGLLLLGGTVYAGFGSHCGITPYKGWVLGFSTDGQIEARWSTEDRFNDGAGVWQAGGAPVSDGAGTFIVSTGNGEASPVPTPGNTPPNVLGESWVRLTVQGDGTLLATDFFSPKDAAYLNAIDADFGSGGPVGLPDSFGTPSAPHLGVAAGKQGYVYLLDRDDLGGFQQGAGGIGQGGSETRPDRRRLVPLRGVAWRGRVDLSAHRLAGELCQRDDGTAQRLQRRHRRNGASHPGAGRPGRRRVRLRIQPSHRHLGRHVARDGAGVDRLVSGRDRRRRGAAGLRHAPGGRNAAAASPPPDRSWVQVHPPGVGDARIYVGNRDGHVLGFGNTAPVGLSGPPVDLGTVTVGSMASAPFQLTATGSVTVSELSSSSSEFTPGNVSPPLPATLAPGATLSGAVTFQPSATGLRTGALVATTGGGTFALAVSGVGQVSGPHLEASPDALPFDPTLAGQATIHAVTFHNLGDAPYPVDSVSVGGPPFSLSGAPPGGSSIGPGQSMTVTVTFAPSAVGTFQDNLTLASSAGAVVVPLSGTAVDAGRLDVDPLELDFGVVQVGQSTTKSFTVSNGGGQRLTITRSKPPSTGVGFTGSPLPEGTSLAPGESKVVNVTFTPTSNGDQTDQWVLNADGTQGTLTVALRGTGSGRHGRRDRQRRRNGGSAASDLRRRVHGRGRPHALAAPARSWGGCSGLASPPVEHRSGVSATRVPGRRAVLAGNPRNHRPETSCPSSGSSRDDSAKSLDVAGLDGAHPVRMRGARARGGACSGATLRRRRVGPGSLRSAGAWHPAHWRCPGVVEERIRRSPVRVRVAPSVVRCAQSTVSRWVSRTGTPSMS